MASINKTHIETALMQGDLGEVIKMTLALIGANGGSDKDNVIIQSARYHSLMRDKRNHLISSSNAAMTTAQITATMQHYIGNLKPDWKVEYDLPNTATPNTATPIAPAVQPVEVTPIVPEQQEKQKVILCLSSNPTNSDRLATDIEIREIRESIRNSRGREDYTIVYETAVSIKDFRRAVLFNEPSIIHFSGHGTAAGEIILHNSSDKKQAVSAEALGAFFELIASVVDLECVVLNACYSEIQAKEIAKSVKYVMGMNNAVADRTAIGFAQTLYQVLADGRGYELAFKFAKNNIMLEGHSGKDLPILFGGK